MRTRVFIFITVFVDMIGYGIIVPLLPLFVAQQGGTATLVGALGALYALAQALGGPTLAALSDRYGRRPLLLFSLLGTAAGYALLGWAGSLAGIILALLVDGLTGGNQSIAQAYIADSTAPEERAQGFGLIGAAFGLGFMTGPVIGGLLSVYGLGVPAFAAAGLALANALFGLFVLPESLPPERRRQDQETRRHEDTETRRRGATAIGQGVTGHHRRSAGHLLLFGVNGLSSIVHRLRSVSPLLITIFLLNLAFAGLQSNFPLYSAARFGWDAAQNSYFYAFVGLCAVLTQAVLLGPLQRRFGNQALIRGGITLMGTGLAFVAVLPNPYALYPLAALLALGANLAIPTITSVVSTQTDESRQGRLMAGVQLAITAALVGGPLIAGIAFDTFGTGAPYLIGGLLAGCALLAAWRTLDTIPNRITA